MGRYICISKVQGADIEYNNLGLFDRKSKIKIHSVDPEIVIPGGPETISIQRGFDPKAPLCLVSRMFSAPREQLFYILCQGP